MNHDEIDCPDCSEAPCQCEEIAREIAEWESRHLTTEPYTDTLRERDR